MFFAIYAGLVNNQRFPRFVRYNGMQAILLDIVLVSRPSVLCYNILSGNSVFLLALHHFAMF